MRTFDEDDDTPTREIGYDEEIEQSLAEGLKHPSPERMLMRQAVKYLTPQQKKLWELHNFDRLTQDAIATELGISQQSVSKQIKSIESKISKWVKSNWGAYELLKADYRKDSLND